MTSSTDLHYLSATDAVGLFRRRELSPRELMVNADVVPYRVAASLEAEQGPFFDTHRPALGAP